MFVVLTLLVIVATSYVGVPWWASAAVALALFFFLARAFGKHFKATLGNGDILFWIISQRILPPIVVVIPIYMMFQAVGLLDTHLALIIVYAVANLPIVVWLMHDFFAAICRSNWRSSRSSTAPRASASSGTSSCRSRGRALPPRRC